MRVRETGIAEPKRKGRTIDILYSKKKIRAREGDEVRLSGQKKELEPPRNRKGQKDISAPPPAAKRGQKAKWCSWGWEHA